MQLRTKSNLTVLLGLLLFLGACKKEDTPAGTIVKNLSGFVQKGPFVSGTQVQLFGLSASFSQTGSSFSTQVQGDDGSFGLSDISLPSNYVEFSASGFYFNEVAGATSSAQLTLTAIGKVAKHTTINVNVLTHLEKRRVEYLVKEEGKSFDIAKSTAQSEVLSLFGIEMDNIGNSETLNIIGDTDSNAVLLAISVILQGNLQVAHLTELLANIANDIRSNGVLNNQEILIYLRQSALSLNLQAIRNNLSARYASLGNGASIPNFEKYVNIFLSHTGVKPTATTKPATEITLTSANLHGMVNPGSLETTVTFEYGLTTSLGQEAVVHQSPILGSADIPTSTTIIGLTENTTYYFRVRASNPKGTAYGDILSFSTGFAANWPEGFVHCGNVPDVLFNVTNPSTGKTWMDRNLGASRVATSPTDQESFGDLYQWGRLADGHQCRTSPNTSVLSTTDQPGHSNFITFPGAGDINDWRTPQNHNLWQGAQGINNPCPSGYRLPTETELEAERQSWNSANPSGHFASPLKLPRPGFRDRSSGLIGTSGGFYWTSTVTGPSSKMLIVDGFTNYWGGTGRANGFSVRCIKD